MKARKLWTILWPGVAVGLGNIPYIRHVYAYNIMIHILKVD
jgi:hypothetical protein